MNDIESRLKAVLNDDIDAKLGARRPAPVFQPATEAGSGRGKRKVAWIAPLAAAAAVAAVALGSVTVAQLADDKKPAPPANTGTPTPITGIAITGQTEWVGKELVVPAHERGICLTGTRPLRTIPGQAGWVYAYDGTTAPNLWTGVYVSVSLQAIIGLADITGDGAADAVVRGACNGQGTGGDSAGVGMLVSQPAAGRLEVLGYFPVGYHLVPTMQGREIVVTEEGASGAVTRYRWDGAKLVASTSQPSSQTSGSPVADIRSTDWQNATIDLRANPAASSCLSGRRTFAPPTDGRGIEPGVMVGVSRDSAAGPYVALHSGRDVYTGREVEYGDLTGDGRDDAVLYGVCYGSEQDSGDGGGQVVVVTQGPDGLVGHWVGTIGQQIQTTALADGVLTITWRYRYEPDKPLQTEKYRWDGTTFAKV